MRLLGAMRLVRFRGAGGAEPRLGLEEAAGGNVVDLSAAEPALPRSMRAFLESGQSGLAAAQRWVPLVPASITLTTTGSGPGAETCRPRRALESSQHRLPRETVWLLAPVGDPEKVICVGLNYRDHCLEQNVKIPKEPIIFNKFPSTIIGPFDDIVHPEESSVSTPGTPTLPPSPPLHEVQSLRAPPPSSPFSPPAGGGLGGRAGRRHREEGAAH